MKYPVQAVFEAFQEEMDSEFTDDKNLELFDFILKEYCTPPQLDQLQKRRRLERFFFDIFSHAIQTDATFKSARLILHAFLIKYRQAFGPNQATRLTLSLNETFPRFFKNLVFEKHEIYRGKSINELLKNFREIFGDIVIPPTVSEIQQAIQEECQKRIALTKLNLKQLLRRLQKKEKKVLILDSSFILHSWQNDKDAFFKYIDDHASKTTFLITPGIYDEITLHFEFLDRAFLDFMKSIWICKVKKRAVLSLEKEIKSDEKLAEIRKYHERTSFINDISLVMLGTHLVDYSRYVISYDLDLLRILNHFKVPCRNKFP